MRGTRTRDSTEFSLLHCVPLHCRSCGLAISALHAACVGHMENCRYLVLSNKVGPMVDLLPSLQPGEGRAALMGLLAGILSTLATTPPPPSFEQVLIDTIRYAPLPVLCLDVP